MALVLGASTLLSIRSAVAEPACTTVEQDAAVAVDVARRCDARVEIGSARTETAQTFARPDGGFSTGESPTPRWARKPDGSWADVDVTLMPSADGSISPKVSVLPIVFSGGGMGPVALVRDSDRELALTWPGGALPEPVLSGADDLPRGAARCRSAIHRVSTSLVCGIRDPDRSERSEMTPILNVAVHGKYEYADYWGGMSALITEVVENLKSERVDMPWIDPGEQACFMFADGRHFADNRDWWPDNYLYVAVNRSTGYGGLTWMAGGERALNGSDGISDGIWVSDNASFPDFDPRVVSDPGFPLFYDPRSTVPISQVRLVLENFCSARTGDRPDGIEWVLGELNGQRVE
ncbi:Imm1 family immunity protein [Saccharothrix violaceirubra]|uniref:Uncharacterized protein n=1 Tax=Saccharothrix violaceirubra TaxID=413306 RepID=A0A7W7SYW0_9PSEU|nr:Imm1 family immunity protein [Saccharothrix violaceirubra]MBB4963486.1 hypothetical protein [Saccharothrix violaceirubra]